jgi:hypothetical protein
MKILISGAHGLIGHELCPFLESRGHQVTRLLRAGVSNGGVSSVVWNPDSGELVSGSLDGFDAVIHLAGENIAGRWSAAKKKAIRESRVRGTARLVSLLLNSAPPPGIFISASAIGFYGDRADEPVDEASTRGTGFLADVCEQWEAASEPLRKKGLRVVHLRLGVVLSGRGGALKKMLLPFQLGLGGKLGSGRQIWSWVAIDDVLAVIDHVLKTPALSGAVNVVSSEPVSNAEFTRVLGKTLHRPAVLPMPVPIARILLGEMAQELLLSSARVSPKKLADSGFTFRYPHLEDALRHLVA